MTRKYNLLTGRLKSFASCTMIWYNTSGKVYIIYTLWTFCNWWREFISHEFWHWELLAISQIMRFRKNYNVQQLMHNIVQFDYGTHSSLTKIKLSNHLVFEDNIHNWCWSRLTLELFCVLRVILCALMKIMP